MIPRNGLMATFMTNLETGDLLRNGHIGLISQSGAVGAYLFEYTRKRYVGLSAYFNSGNEAGLQFANYIDFLARDDQTMVIAGYADRLLPLARPSICVGQD
jgi:acyl-CoA synthetase (NDP forming)